MTSQVLVSEPAVPLPHEHQYSTTIPLSPNTHDPIPSVPNPDYEHSLHNHHPPANISSKNLTDSRDILLSKALKSLHPTVDTYRTSPLATSFNWNDVAATLPSHIEKTWYVVAFRSRRWPHANHNALYEADAAAHTEAQTNGGILQYWYGDLNEAKECYAMCVWTDRKSAVKANTGPRHLQAVALARDMYEWFRLERYWLVKEAGKSEFKVVQIEGPPCGV
ncbi:hypothetical protein HDV00_006552 [Rhizophlyctis rosea]|nr:hypothetical protein HDV00_006552 [Rhizophlyctis rosea]